VHPNVRIAESSIIQFLIFEQNLISHKAVALPNKEKEK